MKQARAFEIPQGFAILVSITFLMWLGSSIIVPTLPLYGAQIGMSPSGIGVAVGAYFLGRMIFNLVGGGLVGRVGLRVMAVAACLIAALGSLVAGSFEAAVPLIAGRVLQGAGAGIYATSALATVVSMGPAEQTGRLVSAYQGIGLVGFSVGPLLGGLIGASLGLRAPFFVYAGIAAIAALLAWWFAPGKPAGAGAVPAGRAANRSELVLLLRGKPYPLILLFTFVFSAVRTGFRNSLVPLFAVTTLGMTELAVGSVLAVASAANILVLVHAGRALDRSGRRPVLAWALVGAAGGACVLAVAQGPWALLGGLAIVTCATGYGTVAPTTVTSDISPKLVRGSAIGVQRVSTDLGHLSGPIVGGYLLQAMSARGAFVAMGAAAALAAVLVRAMPETMGGLSAQPVKG